MDDRHFDGKLYRYHGEYGSASEAMRQADSLHAQGYHVRTVHGMRRASHNHARVVYNVYKRPH